MANAATDGRHQRATRSRDAVVRAVLKVVRETGQIPTVARLAELAGVSRRTVFRLFDDMEGLHMAANAVQRAEVLARFPPPMPTGQPLEERVELLVAHRASVYEFIRPLRSVAEGLRDESPAVRKDLEDSHEQLRMHGALLLHDGLPTGAKERQTTIHALGLITSFQAWRSLREDDRLSAQDAKAVIRLGVTRLVG